MKNRMKGSMLVLGAALVWTAGCGGSSAPQDLASASFDDLGTSGFDVTEYLYDQSGSDAGKTPIVGATACVAQHPEVPCSTSNAQGEIDLSMSPTLVESPEGLAFTFTAAGYLGRTQLFAQQKSGSFGALDFVSYMLSTAEAQALFNAAGVTFPQPGTGYLVGSISAPNIQVNASNGTVTYLDDTGAVVTGATQTVTGGRFVVAGMTPGTYTLVFAASGNATVNCSHVDNGGAGFDTPYMPSLNQADGYVAADSVVLAQDFLCSIAS